MGLLRGVARTAVVAGTATAVSGRVQRRQAAKWDAQDAQQDTQPMYQAPPVAEEAAPDPLEQLKTLGELKQQGVLTEEEFAAQKAKILGG